MRPQPPPQEKGKKKKKEKKNEMNPPPRRPPPKLPKISVVNKSQNKEAFELRSQLEEIYQYWSVCL